MARMPHRKCVVLLLAGLLFAASSYAQPNQIHAEIQSVYSFQPHTLSHDEIAKKSAALDSFWNKAKSNPSVYIAGLRSELADFNNPQFFLFDGSMLLLSLSDTHDDRKIALAAASHCDLRDVQPGEYFYQVHRLASLGEDTTSAAFHVLDDPKFQVFVPEHALTLAQNYVLVYLLMPTSQDFWLQPAIDRLRTEKDETAAKSLLLLLWYAQTPAADNAINIVVADSGRPASVVNYAKELMKRKSGISGHVVAIAESEDTLRKKRQERMQAVSDEALYDLDDYTREIMAKRK
jgi:hypothetical protein